MKIRPVTFPDFVSLECQPEPGIVARVGSIRRAIAAAIEREPGKRLVRINDATEDNADFRAVIAGAEAGALALFETFDPATGQTGYAVGLPEANPAPATA